MISRYQYVWRATRRRGTGGVDLADEVEAISALSRNERTGPDPDTFDGM